MYGSNRVKQLFVDIARKFAVTHCQGSLTHWNVCVESSLQTFIPQYHVYAHDMDEEQERELENEIEEERQIQRPGKRIACTPHVSLLAQRLADGSGDDDASLGAGLLSEMFANTSVALLFEKTKTTVAFSATSDFLQTVTDSPRYGNTNDAYARSVHWIVLLPKRKHIVAVSAFEANELLPKFRRVSRDVMLVPFSCRTRKEQDHLRMVDFAFNQDQSSTLGVATSSMLRQLDSLALFAGEVCYGSNSAPPSIVSSLLLEQQDVFFETPGKLQQMMKLRWGNSIESRYVGSNVEKWILAHL
jgi:hypothetical protein